MAALITWFTVSVTSLVNKGLGNKSTSSSREVCAPEDESTNQQSTTTKKRRVDINNNNEGDRRCLARDTRQEPLSTGDIQGIVCYPKRTSTRMNRSRPSSRRQSNATGKCKRPHYILSSYQE